MDPYYRMSPDERREHNRRGMRTTCALCNEPMFKGRGSRPPGQAMHHACRRKVTADKPAKTPPTHEYNCVVCDTQVVGKYPNANKCEAHRHWKPTTCATCDKQIYALNRNKPGRNVYCLQHKREPKPKPTHTELKWKQCVCSRWICKPGRKYCNPECSKEAHGNRNRTCRQCSTPLGYFSRKHLCDTCGQANALARKQADRNTLRRRSQNNHRRRARYFGVEYEPINPTVVFERDNWKCGICRKRVNKKLNYPHPMSKSLDHITPMALGGGHTYINTQCAHLQCNSIKSHIGTGDQLALIG